MENLDHLKSLKNVEASKAALLVVDMQKGFCSPGGGLDRAGVSIKNQRAVIPAVRKTIEVCRAAGVPILWSQQVHYPNDRAMGKHIIPTHHQKRGIRVCVRGTSDVEFVDELADQIRPEDHVFEKHRASCFFETTLGTKLRMLDRQIVIITGVNTNMCVDSTVRDAYFRDHDVIVVKDAVACSFDDLQAAFLKNFALYFAEVITLAELTALLNRPVAVS